ncbi:MAG: sulfatase-like hydrolase/transferase [bacterium]
MEPESRSGGGSVLLALVGLALAGGAAAGGIDAAAALAQHQAATRPIVLLANTASFAASLALLAALPLVLGMAFLGRPHSAARRLGLLVAWLAASPAWLVLARSMHKRIPWHGADLRAGLFGLAAIAIAVVAVGEVLARLTGRRAAGVTRVLARTAPWLLVLLLPAAFHVARSAAPVDGGRGSGHGPNLLLLTIDTLRADRLGTYGDPTARTPWMDRLARTSVLHATCVTPAPWTVPALGSLLTGTYPGQHRLLEEMSGLSDAVPSLAECARAGGRRTAAFVSNPWLATGSLARGFDRFDVAEREEIIDPIRGTSLSIGLSKALLRLGRLDAGERLTRRSLAWIRDGRGPWFLWVHYFDPHLPNWPAPPFDRLGGSPPRRIGSSLTVEAIRAGDYPGGDEGRREIAALYAGEVAYTDRAIGRLLRGLEASGELTQTAIVLTADHGEELWDHGGYGHGHAMFDEVVRVPLAVRPPGGTACAVRASLARLVDVAPTALAAAAIDCAPPHPFAGVDLARAEPAASTYGEAVLYGPEQKYVRTNRWKLILDPAAPDARKARLFDLESDPGERRDLAQASPAEADTLLALLEEWRLRVGSATAGAPQLPENVDPAIRAQLRSLGYLP